jgi:hypothetical protein
MVRLQEIRPRSVGMWLLASLVVMLAGAAMTVRVAPAHAEHQSSRNAEKGFTGGWLDGRTVQFFYNKPFFCAEPPESYADSGCEVGVAAETAPRGGNIPVLYVVTPLFEGVDAATLQCPVSGACINHPSTLDVTAVFGDSEATRNFALPPHSHIVDVDRGGWWEIEVVGVFDPAAWEQIVEGKSLETLRAVQDAHPDTVTGDIPSNLYLFFEVQ